MRKGKRRLLQFWLCGAVVSGIAGLLPAVGSSPAAAAQRGGGPPGGGRGQAITAQSAAPFDAAGYWVSLVTDEWRYRMLTPPRGNVDYVPVNADGQRAAAAWDPDKDKANGEQCRGYGAVGIMRLPGRLHVSWDDPNTLRIDVDTGTQTRLLHFGMTPAAPVTPAWQGYSAAEWLLAGRGAPPAGRPRFGELKVVTTHLRPGYLRKNGVPYGERAVLTEYFHHLRDDDGLEYLAVTTMLEDQQYLLQPWVRTSQFKKQPGASGWNPTPCSER